MNIKSSWLGFFLISTATIAIAAALYVIGSPSHQQELRMDERRVKDLSKITNEIEESWKSKHQLPKSLKELVSARNTQLDLEDPETKEAYSFKITGQNSFQLCANFSHSSIGRSEIYSASRRTLSWQHENGPKCYEIEEPASPEM